MRTSVDKSKDNLAFKSPRASAIACTYADISSRRRRCGPNNTDSGRRASRP